MKCTVCTHPQCHAIDQALLAGDATYEALSRQYGPSPSAIYRHKKHLETKTRRARQRLRDNLSLGFFCKLNNFLAQIQNASQTADAEGNAAVVLKAASVGTRIISSLAKQELPLELDMVYRFLASPQWATQDSLLPTDPQIFTDSHQAIAASLFFLCPDPPTLPAAEDEADDDDENDWNEIPPEDEAGQAAAIAQLLQRLDLGPSPASPPQTHNAKPATPPKNQREITAKLPRKSRPSKNNNQQYQKDNASEKTSAKKPCVGRDPQGGASQSDAPPANHLESEAPPAIKTSHTPPMNPNLEFPLETRNRQPETAPPAPETPHESLFVRLRRKWAKTPPAAQYSCDSELLYEEYLQEKAEALAQLAAPPTPAPPNPQPDPTNPLPDLQDPQPEPPKALEPLCPKKNLGDYLFALAHGYRRDNPPKHIPDRRWEEDFGNPRRF